MHYIRDLTFVTEMGRAIVLAARVAGVDGEVVNIGSGKGWLMGEVLDRIRQITATHSKPVVVEQDRLRPVGRDPEWLVANPAKARRLLNWEAEIPLEEGLALTLADYLRSKGWVYEVADSMALVGAGSALSLRNIRSAPNSRKKLTTS